MSSNKQKRAQIKEGRISRAAKRAAEARRPDPHLPGEVACHPDRLAPDNSYGVPAFVRRGFYVDQPFTCVGCGVEEVWRATQQRWWYEVAKGDVWSTATRCRRCRRVERERKAKARRVHLEGLAAKAARGG